MPDVEWQCAEMSSALTLGWKFQPNPCGSDKALSPGGENLVEALEGERRKIEAFKRELPLCMQLITDAIEALKLHLAEQQHNDSSTASSLLQLSSSYADDGVRQEPKPDTVLEEFIPPKTLEKESKRESEERARDIDQDKPSWMAQVQLWSQDKQSKTQQEQQKELPTRPQAKLAVPGIYLSSQQGSGGAFSPFVRSAVPPRSEEQMALRSGEGGLTLSSSESSPRSAIAEEARKNVESSSNKMAVEATSPAANTTATRASSHQDSNSQRKARRCWSPELHRRFLNALQQLGGSHVATPKQIREIMKVEGLTNDEVKSHLQKYRLHTRRPTATAASSPGNHEPGAQVVVLGGIWVSPDYAAAAAVQKNPFAEAATAPATYYRTPFVEARVREEVSKAATTQEELGVVNEAKSQQQASSSNVEQQDEEMDDGDVTENEDSKIDGETAPMATTSS